MKFSAGELSEILDGEVVGNPSATITRPAKIEEGKEGCISFIANPKYEQFAYSTGCSAIIVPADFEPTKEIYATLIKVKDPYAGFVKILEKFNSDENKKGIEKHAFVAKDALIAENAYIGSFTYIDVGAHIGENVKIFPNCYIGANVEIQANTIIYAGVKIYKYCKIGSRCIIHAGTVIGSDGFGFAPKAEGGYSKVPQLGNVIIENDVEIGANCTIDRATMGSTLIKKGAKLDNLIQIAHNVEIGENTVIASQVGISGSAKLGENCMIGGQAGFVGHINIAAGTKVNAQSGVSKDIKEEGTAVTGSPAFDYRNALKAQAVFRNLPRLNKKIQQLEEKLNQKNG